MGIERLTRLAQALENIPMLTLVSDAVAANSEGVAGLVREQLEQGRGKDGEKIEPKYRNSLYARKKAARNSAPGLGTPDLNDTGAYYRSITARAYATHFEIEATNYKAKFLTPKYPTAIGLNVLSFRVLVRELVTPYLHIRLRELLKP